MRAVPKLEGKALKLDISSEGKGDNLFISDGDCARLTCTLTRYHEVGIYVDM